MKIVKRMLAVLIAAVMLFASVPYASAETVTPIIMVSGFGATTLTLDGEAVFPPSTDKIVDALGFNGMNAIEIAGEIAKWTEGTGLTDWLAGVVRRIMEPIKTDADGNSVYDIKPIISGAENTSYADFVEQDMLKYVPYTGSEFLDMEELAAEIGDENVFNYMYDWRLDYNILADDFKEYIDDVLEITGAEKVSIYSISQGCLVVGQYLYKYADLEQTDKVVFDTPVLGGATFTTDLLIPGPVSIDFVNVFMLLSDILHIEMDLTFLEGIATSDFATYCIDYAKDNLIIPPVKTCLAFWEMVPVEDFDELYPYYLSEEENGEALAAIREFQSGFMTNVTATFENATAHGSEISIKANCGFPLATGSKINSDCIVDMQYSCGAYCADFGTTFPEDYVQQVDNGRNSISPDRTVDLSCGYWPQRTWVINNLYHGQAEWCDKSHELLKQLLFTDNIKDAYSSYEFPQFMESTSPMNDVHISFKSTNNSFLLLEDGKQEYTMTVKNISNKKSITVKGVSAENIDVEFEKSVSLLPGDEVQLTVKADSVGFDTVTVSYKDIASTETLEKSFGVSIIDEYSGATAEDNGAENNKTPFIFRWIAAFFKGVFEKLISFVMI